MGISRQAPQPETAECLFRSEAAAKHVVGLQQDLQHLVGGHPRVIQVLQHLAPSPLATQSKGYQKGSSSKARIRLRKTQRKTWLLTRDIPALNPSLTSSIGKNKEAETKLQS